MLDTPYLSTEPHRLPESRPFRSGYNLADCQPSGAARWRGQRRRRAAGTDTVDFQGGAPCEEQRPIIGSRAWLASALVLSLSLSLIPSALWPCRAAEIVSKANLNGDHLGPPILLDQNGQVISLTTTQSGSSALTNNSDPTYLAYQVLGEQRFARDFPRSLRDQRGRARPGPVRSISMPQSRLGSIKHWRRMGRWLSLPGRVPTWSNRSLRC